MVELIRYNGNFVDCKRQIENANQRIATAREGLLDRIKQGPNSDYERKGCWYPEGTVRIEGINFWCLGKFAPTMHYPQETLYANSGKKYLRLTDEINLGKKPAKEVIKKILELDAKKPVEQRRVLQSSNQSKKYSIQTSDFGNQEVPVFLARSPEVAQKYGDFLNKQCGIPEVNVYQISKDTQPDEDIAVGFWLCGLGRGYDSIFVGDSWGFGSADGFLFGVAKREALSHRKKSDLPLAYKPNDLKILKEVKDGRIPNKALEKIIQRFL